MLNLLLASVIPVLANARCYEPSVAHPLPEYRPEDALLQHSFEKINKLIVSAVASPEYAATSFSVEFTSSKETLWSKHHTARERNASRPDIPEVNGDALYRIASITKTFTVLGILLQEQKGNLNLDDTIDKYITELNGVQSGTLPWKDITVRSLASQLSGIPRECAFAGSWPSWRGFKTLQVAQLDIFNFEKWNFEDPVSWGLPPIPQDRLLACDEYSPNYEKPCTERDLLDAVKSKIPIFAPNQQSTYSNLAYELLGVIIERLTGRSYLSYIEEAIFKPLDMSRTKLTLPSDEAGVIPTGKHYWDVDVGIQSPAGGIYSSSVDLSKYLRYILSHFNGITHALNWLNPVSPSRGLHSFYGIPWEIYQTDRVLQKSRRTVRFITKGGGFPGYTSIIIVAPEYDLGITILVAGNGDLLSKLQNIVSEFIQTAEQVAIQQLEVRYAGTYVSSDPSLNSSVTLVADHRGLVMTDFISNSTNFLDTELMKQWIPKGSFAQLIPTLLFRNLEDYKGEEWRLQSVSERRKDKDQIWDSFCVTDIDGRSYAGVPLNNFVFWNQGKGDAYDTLELSAFRVNLTRTLGKSHLNDSNMEL